MLRGALPYGARLGHDRGRQDVPNAGRALQDLEFGTQWAPSKHSPDYGINLKEEDVEPRTITLDGFSAAHRAVREMKTDGLLPQDRKARSSKYLNNVIEQDHRHIKSRTNIMLWFKHFRNAAIALACIQLMQRVRKGQFNLAKLGL